MMNTKYVKRVVAGVSYVLLFSSTPLLLGSCSDFSDYNEVPIDNVAAGNQTLWENISQDDQLSDFAALVKRTGFDAELKNTRAYTVWAPVNGSFNRAEYDQLSDSLLLAQFVKGHVAEYTHVASGKVEERIHTLNKKSFDFVGDGAYTFDGINISQPNQPGTNGVLHKLAGVAKFYPNLYEYIFMADGIDSLRKQFQKYELTELDQSASVKGPMVNGVQTYIDSVMVTYNTLSDGLNARIANEDSTYTFLLPTNNAYEKMYTKVKSLYNFASTTTVTNPSEYTTATDSLKTLSITVNTAYMSDSLARRQVVRNLVYSNNDAYNQWVVDKGPNTDTLRTTLGRKLSNPKDILDTYAVEAPQELSNGYALLVDSLAFLPWETYNRQITANPINYLANLFPSAAVAHAESVPDTLLHKMFGEDFTYSGRSYSYLWIAPGGDRNKPDFAVSLPDVLSTTYNFYVVFMPSAWPEIANDPRPNWLNFELKYTNAKGTPTTHRFSKAYADSLLSGGTLPPIPTSVGTATGFMNNPEKVDTVFIGRFTFPVSYAGLGDAYTPHIRITTPISAFSTAQLETYTRDVRIAAILLRPVELDEFEAANKK